MQPRISREERREVEKHRYLLSEKVGRDIGFDTAWQDWVTHHAESWRAQRQAEIMGRQREEILRHKWIESEKAGRDLGRDAALDWVKKYAATWRAWVEQEAEAKRS